MVLTVMLLTKLVANICHAVFCTKPIVTHIFAIDTILYDGSTYMFPTLLFPSASLSPDIVETSEPAAVGVSQLEGSPMDTSSPASATQEEAAPNPAQTAHLSQELSGSGDSGLTDRQTDAETG